MNVNYYLFVIIIFCPEYELVVHYSGKKLDAIQVNGSGRKIQIRNIHRE